MFTSTNTLEGIMESIGDTTTGYLATLPSLTAGLSNEELTDFDRALREDLAKRDPESIATTEINGGDLVTFVDGDDRPQTVAQVLAEINGYIDA